MLHPHKNCLILAVFAAAIGATVAPASAQSGEIVWTFDMSNVSGAFVTVGPDGTIYTADQDRLWAISPSGTVKWTFEDAAGAGGLPVAGGGQPIEFLPDGRLVVGAGHTIWALETDGAVSWSFPWSGGYNNQIDNGPSVGPDGNIYATTAVNDGLGLGVFSLTPSGQLRWQDGGSPLLLIINASHGQRVYFTATRLVFGFVATVGAPRVHGYDFGGVQTNLIDACTGSPRTNGVDRLLLGGACGSQSIDIETNSIEWNVTPWNMLPIAGSDGVVYSGSWHGSAAAISPQGQELWVSSDVQLQRTLAVSDEHGIFLYAGETFGQPNWLGAIDTATGASLWQIPFETVGGHNELSWSNEAAFSPDGSVAYFTTRFTSNGAPGRLWAVRIAVGTSPDPCNNDGICAVGEDCTNCPSDCPGRSSGKPSRRWCCGDGVCSTQEDSVICSLDCGAPTCGDDVCDPGEDSCQCPNDCGLAPMYELSGATCSDGVDNDCDNLADCDDSDCATSDECLCIPKNAECTANVDCCSGVCKGNGRCR